jgi:hypothetical protein
MSDAHAETKPNRLLHETSPYLQQHAYNPVDWHPWGEEALRLAREHDRPIFLSVGYSSCHWCHVMERESFEDPEIARLMNENFINIKVDREERPDLDAVYMEAVQLMTQSGGWPMSVFLTPDLKPFWGGTYFPPRSGLGRPGFADVVVQLARVYREDRQRVEESAREITAHLASQLDLGGAKLPGLDALERAVESSSRRFDPHYGGFGPAPKFPRSVEVSMLLRAFAHSGDGTVLEMCERTLDGMVCGGIYDQIGGGFHRYSTDEKWLVPHFEKMLYDNALLVRTYLEAYQVTGKEVYGRVAREVLDYLLREMTSPEGGFYSATDADSEGREGAFFVWTPEQVEAVVGRDDGRIVCHYYNISVGGNFEDSTSIPNVTRSIADLARAFKLDPDEAARLIAEGRARLYAAREERPRPFRDEKVLAAWNGLAISAFARGAQVLGERRYLDAAGQTARLVLDAMLSNGRLLRVRKCGRSRVPAFLDDYAYFVEALLDLYEAGFETNFLDQARELSDLMLDLFWDAGAGGFYYTARDGEALIARKKDFFDNATPSANGVAALSLLRLERLTGEPRYREAAEKLFRAVARAVDQMPMAFASMLIALDFYHSPPVEVAVVGEPGSSSTRALWETVHSGFLPGRVLAGAPGPEVDAALGARVPLLRGKRAEGGQSSAYVCRDYACQAPVSEPEALRTLLPFVRP